MSLAVPLYALGVTLLIAVAAFGVTKKGAQRWLNMGMVSGILPVVGVPLPFISYGARPWSRWAMVRAFSDWGEARKPCR